MEFNKKVEFLIDSLKTEVNKEEESKKSLEKEINYLSTSIEEMTKLIINTKITVKVLKERLEKIEISNEADEKLEKMIRSIFNLPQIEDVEYNEDERIFSIFTEYIKIKDEKGNTFQAGRYEVDVHLENNRVKIYCRDNEYRRRGYWGEECHHPHVNRVGDPCLGNTSEMIISAVGEKDFYLLTLILIGYLESVNVDDPAGRYISNWDMIDEEGDVIENIYKKMRCHICRGFIEDEEEDYCEICEELVCSSCRGRTETGYICDNCIEEDDYKYCDECELFYHEDYVTESADDEGRYICNECVDNYSKYEICERCEKVINTREYCYDVVEEEHYYCDNCSDIVDSYERCEECGKLFFYENLEQIDGEYYCKECAERIRQEEEEYENYSNEEDDEGRYICNECIDSYSKYEICERCEKVINTREYCYDVVEEEHYYCDDCSDRGGEYERCEECGKLFFYENLEQIDGEYYCKECAERIRQEEEEYENYSNEEDDEGCESCPDYNNCENCPAYEEENRPKSICFVCNQTITKNEYITEYGNIVCEDCAKAMGII